MNCAIDISRAGEHYRHTPEKGGVCFFMKIVMRKKCRTVSAKTPAAFDEEFNEATLELGTDIELKWEQAPNTVHIIYTEREQVPETLSETLALRGERYFCKDCPYSEKGENGRCGIQGCKKGVPDVVDYTPACDIFLKDLIQGRVKRR